MCVLQGLDIGPDSLKAFQAALADVKTVVWNGPMGVFEYEKFAAGTFGVAETLAGLKVCAAHHCVSYAFIRPKAQALAKLSAASLQHQQAHCPACRLACLSRRGRALLTRHGECAGCHHHHWRR